MFDRFFELLADNEQEHPNPRVSIELLASLNYDTLCSEDFWKIYIKLRDDYWEVPLGLFHAYSSCIPEKTFEFAN
jgi:hypothetical protein